MINKGLGHIPKRFRRFHRIRHSGFIDIIVSSTELKKLIIKRSEDLKIDIYKVGYEAGVERQLLKELYLEKSNPVSSPALRQDHLIALAELLGINIRLTLIVKPTDAVDVEYLRGLKSEYERRKEEQGYDEDQEIT